MSDFKDIAKVTDKHGFVYNVDIEHFPQHGFSTAYYRGSIIGQVEYGKMNFPTSDDDKEWEEWYERFAEWSDARIADLIRTCENFFNTQP